MRIKRAKIADAQTLAGLLWEMSKEAWAELRNPLYKPKPKKEFLKAAITVFKKLMKDRKHFAFLAVEDSKAIGFVCCETERYKPSLYAFGDLIYVQWLFVKKEHRRKKVATSLMKAVFKEAKKRRISVIHLATPIKSKRNVSFYTKFGFNKYHYELKKVVK